ncbi:MAG: hypothetical protein R3338_04615, partial [Thermoanaerobaculia bacterium]|nr:hypothetical protein [Thermoanaerobaculia bacterium]
LSLVSGKLDVYMLPAMVPGSVLAARYLASKPARSARVGHMAITALIGLVFLGVAIAAPLLPRGVPELSLLSRAPVAGLFWTTAIAAAAGLVLQLRWLRDAEGTSIALGAVALVPLVYLVAVLTPVLNETSSTAPLVRSLERTGVAPAEIGLYWTPHLRTRSMSGEFQEVRYEEPEELSADPPRILAVRRDHADELGVLLNEYVRIDVVTMIGKEFDVYARKE